MDALKLFDLSGKNAIIFGGAGGLGQLVAEAFAQCGANLARPFANKLAWFSLNRRFLPELFAKLQKKREKCKRKKKFSFHFRVLVTSPRE